MSQTLSSVDTARGKGKGKGKGKGSGTKNADGSPKQKRKASMYNDFTAKFMKFYSSNKEDWTSETIESFCNTNKIPMYEEYTVLDMTNRSDKMKLSAKMWATHPLNPKVQKAASSVASGSVAGSVAGSVGDGSVAGSVGDGSVADISSTESDVDSDE